MFFLDYNESDRSVPRPNRHLEELTNRPQFRGFAIPIHLYARQDSYHIFLPWRAFFITFFAETLVYIEKKS